MATALQSRIEALRGFERHVYQMAYYLLQEEEQAAQAAEAALLTVGRQCAFFHQSAEEQLETLKRTLMREAFIRYRSQIATPTKPA